MFSDTFKRRIRGAVGNAIVWGACWSGLTVATLSVLKIANVFNEPPGWLDIIGMAIKIGIFGGVMSGAFSLLIGLLYHRRRLSELNWAKFGLLGGVISGVAVTVFLQGMNILTGGAPIAWNLIDTDIIYSTIFGAVAAGGSLRLAQRAEHAGGMTLEDAGDMNALRSGENLDVVQQPAERVARDR